MATVHDLNLLGDEDENQLKRAADMERILCTYDTNFIVLAAEVKDTPGL